MELRYQFVQNEGRVYLVTTSSKRQFFKEVTYDYLPSIRMLVSDVTDQEFHIPEFMRSEIFLVDPRSNAGCQSKKMLKGH